MVLVIYHDIHLRSFHCIVQCCSNKHQNCGLQHKISKPKACLIKKQKTTIFSTARYFFSVVFFFCVFLSFDLFDFQLFVCLIKKNKTEIREKHEVYLSIMLNQKQRKRQKKFFQIFHKTPSLLFNLSKKISKYG